jgi:hypothetical protein
MLPKEIGTPHIAADHGTESVRRFHQIGYLELHQFAATERAREAERQQGPVPLAGQSRRAVRMTALAVSALVGDSRSAGRCAWRMAAALRPIVEALAPVWAC